MRRRPELRSIALRKGLVVVVAGFAVAGLPAALADLTDRGGDDCKGIASGDARYGKTDNCKGIVKRDKSYCR